MLFTFNKRFLFGAFYLVLAGCTNLEGVSPISSSSTNTNNSSTQFSQAFKTNLISAGLSLDNADFLSVSSPVDLQPMSVKLIFEKIFGSSFHEVSIDSMSKALRAVSDEAHFSSVEEKQAAIKAISEAHLKTVKSLVSQEELSLILSDVAKIVGSEIQNSGLIGDDIGEALLRHGEGFAQAVTDSDFEANLRNTAMSALSKGLVLGLKENANLSASSLELSAKVAEGAALKIANREDNVQDGEEKRKSELSDMLLGFKDGISSCANLTASEKESFLKNFTNSARVSIQNSNHAELNEHFADVAGEALNKKDKELHIITVYEPTSANWVGTELIKGDPSARVNIANGDKEIVLVLSSYETVNWSISGAIARVSKVIAIGYHAISVNGVDPALVEVHSYELNGSYQGNYCGTGSDWPYDPSKIATQAFAICMRDIQGYQISSMQGQYRNNSFVVGDGLNLPPKFRAYSMDLPWYYAESLIGNILAEAKGSETSGEVVFVIKFVKAPLVSTIINAKVVHGTTDTNDFVALETKVTVYPSSSMAFVRLPIKQDGFLEGPESFKIILSSDQKINFLTPVLSGTITD